MATTSSSTDSPALTFEDLQEKCSRQEAVIATLTQEITVKNEEIARLRRRLKKAKGGGSSKSRTLRVQRGSSTSKSEKRKSWSPAATVPIVEVEKSEIKEVVADEEQAQELTSIANRIRRLPSTLNLESRGRIFIKEGWLLDASAPGTAKPGYVFLFTDLLIRVRVVTGKSIFKAKYYEYDEHDTWNYLDNCVLIEAPIEDCKVESASSLLGHAPRYSVEEIRWFQLEARINMDLCMSTLKRNTIFCFGALTPEEAEEWVTATNRAIDQANLAMIQ